MSSDLEPADRGAWADDDQGATTRAAWTQIPDSIDEVSDLDRTIRSFAATIKNRSMHPDCDSDPRAPTVVIMSTEWSRVGKKVGADYMPEVDDGSRQLAGFVFVAPPNLALEANTEQWRLIRHTMATSNHDAVRTAISAWDA